MNNKYFDLIKQSYRFPQDGFDLTEGYLSFNGFSIKYLIDKYGTPLKLMYLPRIKSQIVRARELFEKALKNNSYQGSYHYCYCTKCCHFAPIVKSALKEKVHLETSSSFDIDLIFSLFKTGEVTTSTMIIHNGYKTDDYLQKIVRLNQLGFKNSILVLDSKSEIVRVKKLAKDYDGVLKIGIRIAINEEPQSAYYTSRLGIRPADVLEFYNDKIATDPNISLKMVHFFIDSGIKDTVYYWGEFQKALKLFVQLKQECNDIKAINLGGGFPIRNNLGFNFDFENIINQLVKNIKDACTEANVSDPDIFTEFGKYTVGESGAVIFEVLEQKKQNEQETWYMVDNSLMNTLPDVWSIQEKFILLPINKWNNPYTKVHIGGISCDHSDFYNPEDFNEQLYLPAIDENEEEPLYVGFFHTGAYQDAISGYGGIKHCLIPAPKIIIIDKDEQGNMIDTLYRKEQPVEEMLSILGYNNHDE